ncbi:response regulator transcription factor [Ketobacter sp. MCCC 1A13808]|uniref:response regulator transcription factor n=1 Tax=Ketobacter sp. MCCC 1A13808 TaxID=2602738 RepID=UPI000F1BF819|nr:response regulator transcription factor [Ketobacter sp. MCCC 1A13808]MVF14440.1 response regulator transcription factor [Ketobacter sp. MCCC 1A13808]RLP52768.1 MAG: DNA-binding response regulator [Ketobacter sp.]
MRLLLVEDNVVLAEELLSRLQQAGYAVDWLADGRDASIRAHDENYDIAVLDLGLPGRSGLDVLKDWRAAGLPLCVLILTARDSFADRITGLRAGADDYLTKPFHPDELLLRVQSLLRRYHGQNNAPKLVVGAIALDEDRQVVECNGSIEALSGAEFRLLRYFMLNSGRILTRSQLEDHLYDGERERDSNVLEVLVNRLRRKLGREHIQTHRGQGYCFVGTATQRGL